MRFKNCSFSLTTMEVVRDFLQSSTIHGLSHIAGNRRLVRLLWISVVITGFTGAAVLIHQSFSSWTNSPISTTIETLPISDLDFPNVTVCPPKNSFTSLNPDLIMARNVNFKQEKRKELSDFVLDALFDASHDVKYREFIDYRQDHYLEWYTGISSTTNIPYEQYYSYINRKDKIYKVSTERHIGSFSTPYFRQPFSHNKFEATMHNELCIYIPAKGRVQQRN